MSSSYTDYRKRYVQSNDAPIAVWMYFAIDELRKFSPQEDWMTDAIAYWQNCISIGGGGIISADFETFAPDEHRRQILLTVAMRIVERLKAFGETIPMDFLNSIQIGGTEWTGNDETLRYLRTSNGFIHLLEEDTKAYDDALPVIVDA